MAQRELEKDPSDNEADERKEQSRSPDVHVSVQQVAVCEYSCTLSSQFFTFTSIVTSDELRFFNKDWYHGRKVRRQLLKWKERIGEVTLVVENSMETFIRTH